MLQCGCARMQLSQRTQPWQLPLTNTPPSYSTWRHTPMPLLLSIAFHDCQQILPHANTAYAPQAAVHLCIKRL